MPNLWTPDEQRAQLEKLVHYVTGADAHGRIQVLCQPNETIDKLRDGTTSIPWRATCPSCCRRLQGQLID